MENTGSFVITRTFDAPKELVFEYWSDPEGFKKWWGPKNFTCPEARIDFRIDGKYLACMRSPEGQEFWSTGTYKEIIPGEKIVCTDSFADQEGNVIPALDYGMPGDWPLELLVTVVFEDDGGGTCMILTHEGMPREMQKDAQAGWNESFDKLAEVLQKS